MYKATFIFEGRSIGHQEDDDLCFFPKKHAEHIIDGQKYFIDKFSIIGQTIIYVLKK